MPKLRDAPAVIRSRLCLIGSPSLVYWHNRMKSKPKAALLPDKLNVPILINPGLEHSIKLSQEGLSRGGDTLTGR
jgi:hypothetical protein